jgi:hypothetical protein
MVATRRCRSNCPISNSGALAARMPVRRGVLQPVRADYRQPRTFAGASHDLADAAGRQTVPRRQGTQELGAAAPVPATVRQ